MRPENSPPSSMPPASPTATTATTSMSATHRIAATGASAQDSLRAATLRQIVADAPSALTTKVLADEMANTLASGADAATHDALVVSLGKWLQRATKDPNFADVILHHGTGKGDPTLWGLTEQSE